MPNRCDGCNGHGYVGPLRPNLPPCKVCGGTGRGHVHVYRFVPHVSGAPHLVGRICDGCGSAQVVERSLVNVPKGWEACADADWFDAPPNTRKVMGLRA